MKKLNEQKWAYLFIAPAVVLFLIFVVVPVFASLFLSFTKYNVFQAPQWAGLSNYKEILFADSRFWHALRNTLIYVSVTIPIGLTLSLALAIAIDQKIRLKNFFKTVYFMPTVTAVVAIAVIWKWLYAGEKYGLINYLLLKIGIQPMDWLINPHFVLPAIMIMSIWAGLGYNMVIFLAGLQSIPRTLYEVAEIDGASDWDKFRHITLPLLRPTMVFAVLIGFIYSFQVFEQVYIMARAEEGIGGVLDSALTIVAYLYEKGFQHFQMGYASALAYIVFFCIIGVSLLNLKMIRSKVEY